MALRYAVYATCFSKDKAYGDYSRDKVDSADLWHRQDIVSYHIYDRQEKCFVSGSAKNEHNYGWTLGYICAKQDISKTDFYILTFANDRKSEVRMLPRLANLIACFEDVYPYKEEVNEASEVDDTDVNPNTENDSIGAECVDETNLQDKEVIDAVKQLQNELESFTLFSKLKDKGKEVIKNLVKQAEDYDQLAETLKTEPQCTQPESPTSDFDIEEVRGLARDAIDAYKETLMFDPNIYFENNLRSSILQFAAFGARGMWYNARDLSIRQRNVLITFLDCLGFEVEDCGDSKIKIFWL